MGSNTSSGNNKVLFEMGQSGYAVFRLPAVVYHNGTFLAFCEGRMGIADSSVSEIVLRRGIQKGPDITWKDIQVVAKVEGARLANPVPLVDVTHDVIWVLYQRPLPELGESLLLVKSTDLGETWSAPRDITTEVFNRMPPNIRHFTPGPAHGIQTTSGRLVIPGCVLVKDTNTTHNSSVLMSDDHGESWYPGGYVPSETAEGTVVITNETTAVALSEDMLCLNSRTLGKGQPRAQSISIDGGKTFQSPQLISNLIEPDNSAEASAGCEGCVLGFKAPKTAAQTTPWVLFANPATDSLRMKMSIRISQDGCQTWSKPWRIRFLASGYSDMTQYQNDEAVEDSSNPTFAILYENGIFKSYASVTFQTFTLQNVLNGVA